MKVEGQVTAQALQHAIDSLPGDVPFAEDVSKLASSKGVAALEAFRTAADEADQNAALGTIREVVSGDGPESSEETGRVRELVSALLSELGTNATPSEQFAASFELMAQADSLSEKPSTYDEALKAYKSSPVSNLLSAVFSRKKDADGESWAKNFQEDAAGNGWVLGDQVTIYSSTEGKPQRWQRGVKVQDGMPDLLGKFVMVRGASTTYSNMHSPRYHESSTHNAVFGRVTAQDEDGVTIGAHHFPIGIKSESERQESAGEYLDRSTLEPHQWDDRNVGAPQITVRTVNTRGFVANELRKDEFLPEHVDYRGSIVRVRSFSVDDNGKRTAGKPIVGRVESQSGEGLQLHTPNDERVSVAVPASGFLQATVLE